MELQQWPESILCHELASLTLDKVSDHAVDYAKLLLADYFASTAAGWKVNHANNEILRKTLGVLEPSGDTIALYEQKLYSGPYAAAINAFYAHGADMDDGHRVMGGHPGAPIISAILALAEANPYHQTFSGEDFLLAEICGYEAMVRIGAMVQPLHVEKAFHSTCTIGGAGAAVACGKLLKLTEEQLRHALSLSLVHASGLMTITESAQAAKPLNAADAAMTGYLCAVLAKEGMEGPDNVILSKKGFLHAFGGDLERVRFVTEGMGGLMGVEGCYIKLFPTCRATHAGAEAILALKKDIPGPEAIDSIRLRIYPRAITIAGDKENHVPLKAENAKFSLAFAIACAYYNDGIRIQEDIVEFSPESKEKERELCKKIRIVPDRATEDVLNGRRGCILEVTLTDGRVLSKEIVLPKGDPEVPVSWTDMKQKTKACMSGLIDEDRQKHLLETIQNLEKEAVLPSMTRLLNGFAQYHV